MIDPTEHHSCLFQLGGRASGNYKSVVFQNWKSLSYRLFHKREERASNEIVPPSVEFRDNQGRPYLSGLPSCRSVSQGSCILQFSEHFAQNETRLQRSMQEFRQRGLLELGLGRSCVRHKISFRRAGLYHTCGTYASGVC